MCQSNSSVNCISAYNISESLLNLTQRPQDLVPKDMPLIINIIESIGDGLNKNITTDQIDQVSKLKWSLTINYLKQLLISILTMPR